MQVQQLPQHQYSFTCEVLFDMMLAQDVMGWFQFINAQSKIGASAVTHAVMGQMRKAATEELHAAFEVNALQTVLSAWGQSRDPPCTVMWLCRASTKAAIACARLVELCSRHLCWAPNAGHVPEHGDQRA